MRKNKDIEKILNATDEEIAELKKEFDWLIENFKVEEDDELEKAKQEVRETFSKYAKTFDKISTATLQRKLHIGYSKAAKFIDILAIKNIVNSEFGARDILNKQLFVEEAVSYFAPIVRDRNKLDELNKNDIFAFILHDRFDAGKADYYWLERLISEQFIKDEKFVKALDEVFETELLKMNNLKARTKKVFNDAKVHFGFLVVIVLQYFAEKLKSKTLEEYEYVDEILKEKIRNLRFFDENKGEN